MNKTFLVLFLLCLLTSCSNGKDDRSEYFSSTILHCFINDKEMPSGIIFKHTWRISFETQTVQSETLGFYDNCEVYDATHWECIDPIRNSSIVNLNGNLYNNISPDPTYGRCDIGVKNEKDCWIPVNDLYRIRTIWFDIKFPDKFCRNIRLGKGPRFPWRPNLFTGDSGLNYYKDKAQKQSWEEAKAAGWSVRKCERVDKSQIPESWNVPENWTIEECEPVNKR